MQRQYNSATTRDDRIAIRTALQLRVPYRKITETLGYTYDQIRYVDDNQQLEKISVVENLLLKHLSAMLLTVGFTYPPHIAEYLIDKLVNKLLN
jgi:hypothetical protein